LRLLSVESENDQAMFYTLGRGRGGNVYVYALKDETVLLSQMKIIETGISMKLMETSVITILNFVSH
jgi:hypothetical protein